MDNERREQIRRRLEEASENAELTEQVTQAQLGGSGDTPAEIQMQQMRDEQLVRAGSEADKPKGKASETEQARENEQLVVSFLSSLPNARAKNSSERGSRHYGIATEPRQRNFGADVVFGVDDIVTAKTFQSRVFWIDFSEVDHLGVEPTPHLPFFVIGERKKFGQTKILVAPVNIPGMDEFDFYANYLPNPYPEEKSDPSDTKGIADEIVYVFVISPINAVAELLKRKRETAEDEHPQFHPTGIFELSVTSQAYNRIKNHKDYRQVGYTSEETLEIFNSATGRIHIGPDMPGSLRNGPKTAKFRQKGAVLAQIRDVRQVPLTDRVMEEYGVDKELIDLAIVFGQQQRLDALLAQAK